jgi:serine/threonine protein kinase
MAAALLAEAEAAVGTGGDSQLHLRSKVGNDNWERICKLLGVATNVDCTDADAPRRTTAEYAILRRLGMGGLGSVWLARDQTLNRLVALKEVNERAAESPVALARFRREAEITGQLEHPNIVPVYQAGQDTKTKFPFYVMRFVGKKTLADAIADYHARRIAGLADKVELHRLLGAFLSVCQAVAFAHSRSVLHRDLKPENVALGNFGQVIVLDWGLAKRTDDAEWQDNIVGSATSGSTVEQTIAGQVLGTPHYMSPEQATGRVESMDERTDVYGLGATLFAILTGYAPHEASQMGSARSVRGAELYAAIVDNPTPRCRTTLPDVAAPLDAICAKAMAAAPATRYASAADLAEDIQLWMAGEPTSAYHEPWTSQLSRLFRKHRGATALLFALLLAIVLPLGFLGYSAQEKRAAAQQTRMEALYLDGKGLSVNLTSVADKGRKTVGFMSRVPPIQGIIHAHKTADTEEDDEATWRNRLETIYVGLLRANPEYLSIAYVSLGEDAKEIVHVQRNRYDRASIDATSALRTQALPEDAFSRGVLLLNPGDVALSELVAPEAEGKASPGSKNGSARPLQSTPSKTDPTTEPLPLTLHLAVPIFDDASGELFGAVRLDVDLEYLLALWARDTAAKNVLLFDRNGKALAEFEPDAGRVFGLDRAAANEFLPAPFVAGHAAELKVSPDHLHPGGLFAIKVPLDPRRPDHVMILVVRGE